CGLMLCVCFFFFFSSRRRHTRFSRDWSSDVCSSDLNWFLNQGLGAGTARNKAATYLMITSPEPGAAGVASGRGEGKKSNATEAVDSSTSPTATKRTSPGRRPAPSASNGKKDESAPMPLNVNVQILISADASSEQIETSFSAMRKYLKND